MAGLREALAGRRVLVCVGAGGVGKTTIAASIALQRALDGGRVLVCTIDPAKRLASALGLSSLGNVETRVPAHAFAEAGLAPRGELHAMMLDVKRTWDELVTRHAHDAAQRDRILRNRLYLQMSAALAGSQEYMATEKLHELATERDYDLVVLDTPPTAHALDFLDAPDRILDFLGDEGARALLAPAAGAGRLGLRMVQLGGSYIAKTLARFTGAEALGDVGDFLRSFHGMYEGFKERAADVRELLSRADSGFVVVSSPASAAVDEALAFHERLHAESMPIAGVVANRVTPSLWDGPALPTAEAVAAALPPSDRSLAPRLAERLAGHQLLARTDAAEIERLVAPVEAPHAIVPRLEEEVNDVGGLARIAERLR
jgi:anion-transporting  ArsA/GET3 family ATPase